MIPSLDWITCDAKCMHNPICISNKWLVSGHSSISSNYFWYFHFRIVHIMWTSNLSQKCSTLFTNDLIWKCDICREHYRIVFVSLNWIYHKLWTPSQCLFVNWIPSNRMCTPSVEQNKRWEWTMCFHHSTNEHMMDQITSELWICVL